MSEKVGLEKDGDGPSQEGPGDTARSHQVSTPQQQVLSTAQLQSALNAIPAYTWYATPAGVLTFVNERKADYLGLPKDDPLRLGIDVGAAWDSFTPLLHPDDRDEMLRAWSNCIKTESAGGASIRLRDAHGGYRWFTGRAEPIRARDGTLLYWVGVSFDIQERKQAEFYLLEAQRLARTGGWSLNAAGFDYWSAQLFDIYGLKSGAKPPTIPEYMNLVHPEDRDFVAEEVRKMFAEHCGFDFTKRIVRPDGDIRYVRCVGVATSAGFVGTGIDVTEQEQLTKALRKSEGELRQNLDFTPQFVVVLGPRRERIYINRTGLDYLGTTLERWRDTQPKAELHPDDVEPVQSRWNIAFSDGLPFECEFRSRRGDGIYRWLLGRCNPVRNEDGHVIRWHVAFTDIEERKRAEERLQLEVTEQEQLARALRTSQEELQQILDFTPQIVGVFGPARERIYANQVTLDYYGVTLDQWRRAPHGNELPPEDFERLQSQWPHAVAAGAAFEIELRLRGRDGNYRWYLTRFNPLFDDERRLLRWYVACTDIEDRKRDEERLQRDVTEQERLTRALRKSQEELQQIIDLTPQLVAVFGSRGEHLYINQLALDYFGTTLDAWREGGLGFGVHPDDTGQVRSLREHALSTGSPFELEARIRRRDGSYRWHLARYNPVRDDEGNVLRWYVACIDIEDRKRDEERLQRENIALREQINQAAMFEEIVGSSASLQKVLAQVSKVAPSDSTVLILGETGTGKELIARAIHARSRRASGAFIGVNCAAIPASLIASELFGHEKGAFTGAVQRRLGRFEAAHGGTIFLDEVGDLPMDIQIALLRVLQEHEIERIGRDKPIPVDVRVIAATHRDLKKLVREGKFRQDLFYRLNVVPITMPTLRERAADIPLLVEYFIARFGRKLAKTFRTIEKRTLEALKSYDWPGNVRELQNVIERAVTLSDSDVFTVDEAWLKRESSETLHSGAALSEELSAHEKDVIETALAQSAGRVAGPAGAAAKLGLPTSTLDSKIKRLGIDKYRFKPQPR